MSITTKISCDTSQYSSSMQKVKQETNNAMTSASASTDKVTSSIGKLTQSANASNSSLNSASNQTAAFTDKLKIAGFQMKDLREAFSGGAQSAMAWAGLAAAAVSTVVNAYHSYIEELKKAEEHEKKMLELSRQAAKQQKDFQIEDASKASSKMKELLALRENWKGTQEEAVKEKILQREIALLQEQLAENDRIKVSINGQTVAQKDLADAIQKTMAAERALRLQQLQEDYTSIAERHIKASAEKEKAMLAGEGVPENLASIFSRIGNGDFRDMGNLLSFSDVDMDTLRSTSEELYALMMNMQKIAREYKTLNDDTQSPADFYRMWQARASDKATAEVNAQYEAQKKTKEEEAKKSQEEETRRLQAEARAAYEEQYARETDPIKQRRMQIEKERDEIFNRNINEGMNEADAKRNADVLTWRKLYDLDLQTRNTKPTSQIEYKNDESILTNDLIKQGGALGIQTTDYQRMNIELVKQIKSGMDRMLPYIMNLRKI